MVRLSDHSSANRLPIFYSVSYFSPLASIKSTRQMRSSYRGGVLISPWRSMPPLTLQQPCGTCLPSLQHPHGPKTTRGFSRTCASTGPTRPYYVTRHRASPGQATNSPRDAAQRRHRIIACESREQVETRDRRLRRWSTGMSHC